MRRVVDTVLGSMLLVLVSPLLLGAAVGVLVTSGRPVFFGHVRVGQGGRTFRCWKLRTMRPDAEEVLHRDDDLRARYVGNGFKLPSNGDPRVTPFGRILRRWYIDELPQLVNVLNGTMSIVGPRPVVPEELAEFGEDAAVLLRAKPGLVGAWTSRGRDRPGYPERVRVEVEYVRTATTARDLWILARTIPVVLRGQDEQ